ncbi:hypothetical protein BU24DRAFT_454440 [Aaosphaeria arxii CBS 175.79]|uniref:Zn(2)-C6 fungal-type domain-containing protein n=1 Tax=Aaosphaeria arxii CBS 175.79 TaxID=1450172 RepID=A0A6A5XDC4_9PLEO|nr:uncharacterized protein BU24DRAFT_454440 [Aaosphaeria arxii CBS 175.79]KAF2010900.1 hypothetical protein BU24DRAFT_454440 [Aaosphaeria arxii CBS 175.79]
MANALRRRSHAIQRARTGCLTCRGRKKKCGEEKPTCRGCIRNKLECVWPNCITGARRQSQATKDVPSESSQKSPPLPTLDPAPSISLPTTPVDEVRTPEDNSTTSTPTLDPTFLVQAGVHDEGETDGPQSEFVDFEFPYVHPQYETSIVIPQAPSVMPQLSQGSFDLLSHYLSRTANSMGNGSTESNPFIIQIVPLAFSSELILRLILTQSAAQRALSAPEPAHVEATEHYTTSLGLFRSAVEHFIAGSQTDSLIIAAGALILCFTETARGDTQGIIFDHLTAAQTTLSMISVNPLYSEQLLLSPDIAKEARALVESHYVGHLCGCWLELLLFIPQIFELRRKIVTTHDTTLPIQLGADEIIEFSEVYHRILRFIPDITSRSDTYQACFVFQKAVILYHLTVLENTVSPSTGAHRNLINDTIADSMGHLECISSSSRINTSLCWPLAVIGSCSDDEVTQSYIRTRLQIMSGVVGLGNIDKTLTLLEYMWCHPNLARSPWTICDAMQEAEMWFSFA